MEGIYRLLLSGYTEPVNLGNPSEITILEFAKEIMELVGNPKAHIVYKELPVDDPKVRQPDIGRAKEVLGWEPRVKREEGLEKTLEYFRLIIKKNK